MTVIFLFPLALSVVGTFFLLASDEVGIVGKVIAVLLTGTSIVLQFAFTFDVHFMVPLAMQLIVCIWVALFWQLQ